MFSMNAMAVTRRQMVPYGGAVGARGVLAGGMEHDHGSSDIAGESFALNTRLKLSMLEFYLFSFAWVR